MTDLMGEKPLPVYKAIFYKNQESYIELLDYIKFSNNYEIVGIIDIDKMNKYSKLSIVNTLSNADSIIEKLEKYKTYLSGKKITDQAKFNEVLRKIEKNLNSVDKVFSRTLIYEMRGVFYYHRDEIYALSNEINTIEKENIPYKKEYLEELEKDIVKNSDYNKYLISVLDNAINVLSEAKQYIDMYYKIDNIKENNYEIRNVNNPTINFLTKSMFNFCIPQHYILFCIIENNKFWDGLELWNKKTQKNNSNDVWAKELHNVEIYEIYTISDYINVSVNHLLTNYENVKICNNCYNYFIPVNRTDEKYCDRISPQNLQKTCKEYGAKKTYRDEIKSIPVKSEHNKTSQFFRMRINRTKDNKGKNKYLQLFDKYKINFQNMKSQYKSGKLNEKEFIEWIINQKEGAKNGSNRNNKK